MSANIEQLHTYPEILGDLESKWFSLLLIRGITDELAHEISLEATEIVRRDWGGQKIYIAKGVSYNRQKLKGAIYSRWNGQNTVELCREFKITESYLRRLHDEARKETMRANQPDLF